MNHSAVTVKNKILLGIALFIMVIFFIEKNLVVFNLITHNDITHIFEYVCFLLFCPPSFIFVRDFLREKEKQHKKTVEQLQNKNTYLEHAAKILRHDMHSGINVYIPRGVSSLERRIPESVIKEYKLESPLKLLKEGLSHTQKVYKGVYEFTNLVKSGNSLKFELNNIDECLISYLDSTAYKEQVIIDKLPAIEINEPLFCTAIDNLIRNGLKYNDSENKLVVIYMLDEDTLAIQDNGRGMTQEEFELFSKQNIRRKNQKEDGSGLGLGICVAILNEHNFFVSCEKIEEGTIIKIKIK
jgi:light-regulated signal transduction histidine kinase (bacteriophytochrome)